MLQILVSFGLGEYVGTEYELKPHIDLLKAYVSQFEKKKETPLPPSPPKPTGWFGWSKGNSTEEVKKEK